jgi:hypothetical protein
MVRREFRQEWIVARIGERRPDELRWEQNA